MFKDHRRLSWLGLLAALGMCPVSGAVLKTLPGHVPAVVARLHPDGRLAADARLDLAIGLPLRNRPALDTFLGQLYNPASTNFHRFLTPAQFTARFGPTAQDYQAVIQFAQTNGLSITRTHGNRVLLDVNGSVADIEKAFHVTLRTYRHPTEPGEFFAPDTEPSVAADLPVLDISGLSDLGKPRPLSHRRPASGWGGAADGSSPGGGYLGNDFRNAYVPGTTLDGSGQMVGLIQFTGYDSNDIAAYETQAGLPNVPLQNIFIDDYSGAVGDGEDEACLDIEMAISMATNLAAVVVFEATNNAANWNDVLNAMASSNQIKQFSSSWGYSAGPSQTADEIFQQMAAQGQSFFQASGDGDAWTGPIWQPAESPYVTSVGGTTLTTSGAGGAYLSETVWNWGDINTTWPYNGNGSWGSGGGVSGDYLIPDWQTNVDMTTNLGSTVMRNIPDVALVADNIYVTYGSGTNGIYGGTSCAAPLWAGFTALVNQQAASLGSPPVGFINPAVYALGGSTNYAPCFHDISTGSNTWGGSPDQYYAVPGYDLCTGWGTPTGTNLIAALAGTTTYDRQELVRNGGFETGYFTGWTLFGDTADTNYIYNAVETPANGFDVAHSGSYGAFLGDNQLAVLAQTLATDPGQIYLLSFWLDNPVSGPGQQFEVNWNTNAATNTIYYVLEPPAFSWTNFNFAVTATGTNTTLQFGAENATNYFGLDDVSVTAMPAPSFSALAAATNGFALTWNTYAGATYLIQYKTNLLQVGWLDLGGVFPATGDPLTVVDTNAINNPPERFYRLSEVP
jgi:Pro-kumamolisin, activation domain